MDPTRGYADIINPRAAGAPDNSGLLLTTTPPSNGTSYPEVDISTLHYAIYLVIVPVLFGIITLIGIFGNSLVIYVIISEKKWRSVMNIMLLNLAISDLSFVLVCPPFTAYRDVLFVLQQPLSGPVANFLCKLMQYLLNVTVYVTIYTLVLISVIRYMALMHTNCTARIRTHRNIICAIITIWLIIASAHVPVLVHYGTYYGMCTIDSGVSGRIMFTTFTAFAYVLPLCIIVVFSMSVRKQLTRKDSFKLTDNKNSQLSKMRASRLLVFIVASFAILWMPIHLYLNLGYWGVIPGGNDIIDFIGAIAKCMAYANSCVNPIIYNFISREFRESFRRVICFHRKNRKRSSEQHTMEIKLFLKSST